MENLTAHMIVQNEENWIYYAINSVLPHVVQIIIYDTGSIDKTVQIIKTINNPKILFEEKGEVDAVKMVALRNEQIEKTKTSWFMLVDGDEIYPSRIFDKIKLNENYNGFYLRNYLCVGDVWHKLQERYGKYELCDHKGHFNLRFYRKQPGWKWLGKYPLEYYASPKGESINLMCNKLKFVDDYYWHVSFLKRSRIKEKNIIKYHLGEKITDVPEVLKGKHLAKRSIYYISRSLIDTPLRYLKSFIK